MNEKEGKTPTMGKRDRAQGIFFMMMFNSATSSSLTLVAIKSKRKQLKSAKLKSFQISQ